MSASVKRDFIVRADGEFVRDARGRLVKFTEKGAYRWINRRRPQSASVVRLDRHHPGDPS